MSRRDKPLGVDARTADRIQALLRPDERLRYVFGAQINVTTARVIAELLTRSGWNFTGHVDVVITDQAILFVDPIGLASDPRVHADLPLQSTFGPVTGRGWIHIHGRPVFVMGGRRVIEWAEAALRA